MAIDSVLVKTPKEETSASTLRCVNSEFSQTNFHKPSFHVKHWRFGIVRICKASKEALNLLQDIFYVES